MPAKTMQEWIEEQRRLDAEMDAKVVSQYGFTRGDLKKVFDMICNPTDWKVPIAISVGGEMVIPVVEAIKFFTATNAKVSLNVDTMRYLVTSEGYRNGPAGDH